MGTRNISTCIFVSTLIPIVLVLVHKNKKESLVDVTKMRGYCHRRFLPPNLERAIITNIMWFNSQINEEKQRLGFEPAPYCVPVERSLERTNTEPPTRLL